MSGYSAILHHRNVPIIVENYLYRVHGEQTYFLTMTAVINHIDKQFENNLEEILKRIAERPDCTDPPHEVL